MEHSGVRCTAVMLAAGKGQRMGGDIRKQFLMLGGMPLFLHSIRTMQESEYITDIIVMSHKDDVEIVRELLEEYGYTKKLRKIAVGGKERVHSVANGLESIDWPCDYVFVHDSARPFIDDDTMERLYREVKIGKACIAAVPSKDTVKIADQDGFVAQTPNRKDVWLVQTPQVFDFELIRAAYVKMAAEYDELLEKGVIITDDAMVAEYFTNNKVRLVMASYRNIKVTTPEDMDTVAAYMKEKS